MTPAGELNGRATVNILQAAERAQVSRRTIYHWLDGGKLDYVRTPGGRVRIFTDSLWRASRAPYRRSADDAADEPRTRRGSR